MTDPQGFLESVNHYVNSGPQVRENRMGTIHAAPAAGLVRVKFDGEDTASPGGFAYNEAVTFEIGDRVQCLPSGSTYTVAYKLST